MLVLQIWTYLVTYCFLPINRKYVISGAALVLFLFLFYFSLLMVGRPVLGALPPPTKLECEEFMVNI